MGKFRTFLRALLQPTARWSIAALVGLGVAIGLAATIAFDTAMHLTSTESFCVSCHTMQNNALVMLQETSHYHNKSGVAASCSDCHLPQAFIPKMIRKIEASREVWGELTGIIDTPEKYAAHAPAMKAREIARLKANDSQECRNCHDTSRMLLLAQTAKARDYHQAEQGKGKTCIDCHAGLAHTPSDQLGLLGGAL